MRVLTLTTQKGGAGKTTLATSLAVAAAQDGEQVIAIDLDPQGTLYAWGLRRGEREDLVVDRIESSGLAGAIRNARANGGASLVVVDTPGIHGPALALGVADADFALIPVKPSLFDVEATRPVVKLLRQTGKRFGFVLNQVNVSSGARNLDAAGALVAEGAAPPPMIAARNDFLDAATAGLGVTEFAPKGRSAAEIRFLWQYVKTQLPPKAEG
jgi:chromosome partitioning protein